MSVRNCQHNGIIFFVVNPRKRRCATDDDAGAEDVAGPEAGKHCRAEGSVQAQGKTLPGLRVRREGECLQQRLRSSSRGVVSIYGAVSFVALPLKLVLSSEPEIRARPSCYKMVVLRVEVHLFE